MAKLETLKDPFSGNTLNTGLWAQFTAGSATFTYSSAGASVNFPATSSSSTDGDLTSVSSYDFTNSYVVQQNTSVLGGTNCDSDLALWASGSSSNSIQWQVEAGTLYAQNVIASAQTNLFSVTYSPTNHAWLRIREGTGAGAGGTAGNTYWDTSPDGINWTNRFSKATPITVTAIKVNIGGISFGVDSSAGTYSWKNFNVLPSIGTMPPLRIPNKSVGPMALRNQFHRPTFVAGAVINNYTQPLTGTLSFTGPTNLGKAIGKNLTAGLSFVGAISKAISKTLTSAGLSFTGALGVSRLYLKALTAILSFTATSYKDTVLSDSPVSYWRLGETAGASTAVDQVSAHNATYTNSPTLGVSGALTGDSDTAMTVAGASSQYANAGSLALAAGNFSVEAWFNWTNSTVNQYAVSEGSTSSNNPIWGLQGGSAATAGQIGFFIRDNTGAATAQLISGSANNDGNWHHAVATIQYGTTAILYVDGVQVNQVGLASITLTVNTFSIGLLRRAALSSAYSGSIDEVAVYNTILTPDQVKKHYLAGALTLANHNLVHTAGKVFTAALSFSGNISKQIAKQLTATLSFVGSLLKAFPKAFTAGLSFVGALTRRTNKPFAAGLSFVGAISKVGSFTKTLTAGLSFSGAIAKQTGKHLTGGLSFSGAFAKIKVFLKSFTAGLSFSGSLSNRINKGLSAGLSFTGSFAKGSVFFRTFTAALTFTTNFKPAQIFWTRIKMTVFGSGNSTTETSGGKVETVGGGATIEAVTSGTKNNAIQSGSSNTTVQGGGTKE